MVPLKTMTLLLIFSGARNPAVILPSHLLIYSVLNKNECHLLRPLIAAKKERNGFRRCYTLTKSSFAHRENPSLFLNAVEVLIAKVLRHRQKKSAKCGRFSSISHNFDESCCVFPALSYCFHSTLPWKIGLSVSLSLQF